MTLTYFSAAHLRHPLSSACQARTEWRGRRPPRSPHASTDSLSLPRHSTVPDDHRRHHSDLITHPCLPSTMPATGTSRRRRHDHAETAPAPTLATPVPGISGL
jgi:hypothetical protein